MSDRIKKSDASDFALSGPSQHGWITKVCLLYLDNDDFLQQTLSVDLVEQYAFARYAAEYWFRHYREADGRVAEQLSGRIAVWLLSPRTVDRWTRIYDPERQRTVSIIDITSTRESCSPIYYASLLGLDSVLACVLSKSAADINTQEGECGSALQAASQGGHEKVVQMLLDRGAGIGAQGEFENALQAALRNGHQELALTLLDRVVDVNARGHSGTALQAASRGGCQELVRLLLDKGADVNAQGGTTGTALYTASERGYKEVVQLLLDRGADVNAKSRQYLFGYGVYQENALNIAVDLGHTEIAQMLRQAGGKEEEVLEYLEGY